MVYNEIVVWGHSQRTSSQMGAGVGGGGGREVLEIAEKFGRMAWQFEGGILENFWLLIEYYRIW